ncbi:SigB/SigF/SigG family RNA polymerase sigma factor [Aquipuribacter sp. MA13-6]|uniref:SigB/SigF/SigG family RNA polymerase sigma factor n=1 Tax=unclassified Aquipuribacter TaxID=2635084 RepID=UPI003EEA5852
MTGTTYPTLEEGRDTRPTRRDGRTHRPDPPAADLLRRLAAAVDPTQRQDLTDEVVRLHLPAARALALRYRDRGVALDDLFQVAALGLVKAVRGYDCDRGPEFMAYATPTITGELKRYFRDTRWVVRPSRRLQELRPRIARATEELTQQLGCAPTVKDLARHLEASIDDVLEAMVSGNGYHALSLDAPPDGEQGSWADLVPDTDDELAATPDRMALQALLAGLPPRDRAILAMRFFADMTQTQIGAEIGITQMQVSRLLSRALRRLRVQLEVDEPAPMSDGRGRGAAGRG